MKLLSIDIGIKHLAHCLLQEDGIIDWEVNNLDPPYRCCSVATHSFKGYLCKKCLGNKSLTQLIGLCQGSVPLGTKKEMISRIKKVWDPLTPTMVELGKRLIQVYQGLTPEVVIIENQIGPLASKMKAIQGMVVQYWLMRGAKVECISAVNKLKLFHQGPTTYAERKKLSIKYAKEYLKEKGWDETPLLKHKKKDDLADTLLQAAWFLSRS